MWRIETSVDDAGVRYDRRAVAYDRLVRSRAYNRLAWSTSPGDYEQFAETAFESADGPLLEVAAGSAAATAELHARAARPTVVLDLSRPMLDRAAQRIAASGGGQTLADHVRLLQADLFAIPPEAGGATTILGLGLTHLFDDVPGLVAALRTALRPGGRLWLSGLVAETRRGRRYLGLLHRAGEVGVPRTAAELRTALGRPAQFSTKGCMAYATLDG